MANKWKPQERNWISSNNNSKQHHKHQVKTKIIIIIIMCRQHGFPWPSLATSPNRSSPLAGLHPVSSKSCCAYVRAGRSAFARPYVGVHRSTSLMTSSLLLRHCPACLVRLTWRVFVMGGRWLYSWCLVGCCRQGLFYIARSILVLLPSKTQQYGKCAFSLFK